MLAQLLKLNGASKVVLVSNKGIKMDIAKDMEVADVYIELHRFVSRIHDPFFSDFISSEKTPRLSGTKLKQTIPTASTL